MNTNLVTIEESDGIARVTQHYSMTTTADALTELPRALQTFPIDTWQRSDEHWLLAKTQTLEIEVVSGVGLPVAGPSSD